MSTQSSRLILGLALLVSLTACGGGSSPSEPDPPAETSLDGLWQGSLTAIRVDTGGRMTCDLTLDLVELDQPDILTAFGDWRVSCPNGSAGGGTVNVTVLPFGLATLSALPGDALDGCGWAGPVTFTGDRLSGDWQTAEGEGCTVAREGQLDLRR